MQHARARPQPRRTIENVGPAPSFFGLFELQPLRLEYNCGPSDADGLITIRDVTLSVGSSRVLKVPASHSTVKTPRASFMWSRSPIRPAPALTLW